MTVDWRDPPNNNPESQLIGDFYQCNPVHVAMVVVDPDNWLFAGHGRHRRPEAPGRGRLGVRPLRPDRARAGQRRDPHPLPAAMPRQGGLLGRHLLQAPRAGPGSSRPGPSIGSATWTSTACPTAAPGGSSARVTANLLGVRGRPRGLAHPSAPAQSTVRSPAHRSPPTPRRPAAPRGGGGPASPTAVRGNKNDPKKRCTL